MEFNEELPSHNKIISALKKDLDKKRISHAYLFSGPEGVGKMEVARSFIKLFDGENNENKIFLDQGNSIGIDEIRELLSEVHKSSYGEKKIIVIENAERMTTEAENAILKCLEEPPGKVFFVFTTRNYFFLLPTIISRMRVFHFHLESEQSLKEVAKNSLLSLEEQEEAVQIANGRMKVLRNFIKNPDLLFAEKEQYRKFERLSHSEFSPGEIFDFAEEISAQKEAKKDLQSFFESFLFFLRFKIIKNARRQERDKVVLALERVEKIKKSAQELRSNTNLKLVIENLMLSF